jgi:hypothetical protein
MLRANVLMRANCNLPDWTELATRVSSVIAWVRNRACSHSSVDWEWPVTVRLLYLKKRPRFNTRRSLKKTKIWSWVPTGPETKNACVGEDQLQITGLYWAGTRGVSRVLVCERCHTRWPVCECPFMSPPVEGEWPVILSSLLLSKRRSHLNTCTSFGKNKNMIMGPHGSWNRELLCWRPPAAVTLRAAIQ